MSYIALKNILATAALASPEQFENWQKAWRVAVTNGSQESLLEFVCRESGISEEAFLQQLGALLVWPILQLRKLTVPTDMRNKTSTNVDSQYLVLLTDFQ